VKKVYVNIILFMVAASPLISKTIWTDRSLYAPDTEITAGSVLMVNINDVTELKFNVEINSKENADMSLNPDTQITGFLTKAASNRKISSTETGQYAGKSRLRLTVAAAVQARNAQGLYPIIGQRTYSFNGSTTVISVQGLVDPSMIKGRIVDADMVAGFRLDMRVTKEGIELRRARLGAEDKSSTDLTEQEKQDIIIEYLQRVLREAAK
jgi:flagellar basal body L-ring protein FlgH